MPLLAKERYGVHGCRIAADCAPTESAGALEAVSFSLPSSERVVGFVILCLLWLLFFFCYSCWLCHCYVSLLAFLFLFFLLAFLFLLFLLAFPMLC